MSKKQVSFDLNDTKIINYDPNIPVNKLLFLWNHKIIVIISIGIITLIFILLNKH